MTGLLVPPNDATALAHALARLLTDEDLRHQLGQAGRAKVVAEYEINRNAATLLEVFHARLDADLSRPTHDTTRDLNRDKTREVRHAF